VNGKMVFVAGQNAGQLKLFELKKPNSGVIALKPDDVYAIVQLRNGQRRKEEFYFGTSFLSQSGRNIYVNASIQSVEVVNEKGQRRIVFN